MAAINNIQKHLTITAQDWKDTQRYCTYLSKSHLFGQLRGVEKKKGEKKKKHRELKIAGR